MWLKLTTPSCYAVQLTRKNKMNKQNNYGATKLFVFIDDERNPSQVDWFKPLLTTNQHSAWLKLYNPTNTISNNQESVVIIRTFFDFVRWIDAHKSKPNFDWNNVIFSFDHDLQDWHQKSEPNQAKVGLAKPLCSPSASLSLIMQYGINYPYGEHPDKIELTGASCLQYLLDNVENVNLDNIDLHTKNPIAINSMRNIANRYNFQF